MSPSPLNLRIASRSSTFATLLVLLCSCASAGCLGSRPALTPRFYLVPTSIAASPLAHNKAPALRLGRVTAAPHLRDRITWRLSDVELAFDEESRWAVPPEDMLKEAIELSCFVTGRLLESKERGTPTLDVHLESFEGRIPESDAVISIRMTLKDGDARSVASRIVRLEPPLSEVRADTLARALGAALDAAATEIAEWVVQTMKTPTP